MYQLTTTTYREQRDSARTERDAARRDAVAAEKDATESRREVYRLNGVVASVNQMSERYLFDAIQKSDALSAAKRQILGLKDDCRVLLQENRMQAASIRLLEADAGPVVGVVAAGPIKAGDFVSFQSCYPFI